jgi:D-alanyl-D-alanine carboxypeptidase
MKLKKGLILMLAVSLSLGGCIGWGEHKEEPSFQGESTTTRAPETTVTPPAEPLYPEVLENPPVYREDIDEDLLTTEKDLAYLLLVNKQNPLGMDYVPSNLAKIPSDIRKDEQIYLDAGALEALKLMMAEMRAEGITDTLVTSAYRSYEYQASVYNKYLIDEMKGISLYAFKYLGDSYIYTNYDMNDMNDMNVHLTLEDAKKVVDSYSSAPGFSEHQSGLCVDFIEKGKTELDETFAESEAFAWLSENAYRFGFILRYPDGKEDVTGYSYEPWHYRFVGREAATEIYAWGDTLEEYLYLQNP